MPHQQLLGFTPRNINWTNWTPRNIRNILYIIFIIYYISYKEHIMILGSHTALCDLWGIHTCIFQCCCSTPSANPILKQRVYNSLVEVFENVNEIRELTVVNSIFVLSIIREAFSRTSRNTDTYDWCIVNWIVRSLTNQKKVKSKLKPE